MLTLFETNSGGDIARLHELTDLLNRANEKYRLGKQSGLTDSEFDKLLRELKTLEEKYPNEARADSPTKRIGIEPASGHVRIKHGIPMLSIDNVYTLDALAEYLHNVDELFRKKQLREPLWSIEKKVDGVAVSLIYKQGQLTAARTRGDGEYGDDVLANVKTICDVPLVLHFPWRRLPSRVEIRGEIFMPTAAFQAWNETAKRQYANSRAATVGAIRLLDPRECAKRPLSFMAHTIADPDFYASEAMTQSKFLCEMEQVKIPTPRISDEPQTTREVLDFCRQVSAPGYDLASCYDFEIDGIVIKLNDFSLREILGTTSTAPRWVIAFKPETYEATTPLKNVTWQVGKTGICSPVAELESVRIAGTNVSRATLFNLDNIAELGLHIGDTVTVIKGGKIIPHIVGVARQGKKRVKIVPPKQCPSCGGVLTIEKGRNGTMLSHHNDKRDRSTVVLCENPQCKAQLADKIIFYASRDGVDIPGIGDHLAATIVEAGVVKDIADLYSLTEQGLKRIGVGPGSAKLPQAIQARKTPPLEKFLHGLTIPNVGRGTSQRLAKHCRSLAAIIAASEAELAAIVDIGPVTARSITQFFHSNHWNTMAKKFQESGVRPADLEPITPSSQALAGMTIVVTGTLENYDRRSIEATIQFCGGKVSDNVTRKTSYVLVGAKPGGRKQAGAQTFGIPILTETQFNEMIGRA